MFADLMCGYPSGVSFVDLQYGDVSSVVNEMAIKGLPVIHENNVNPLKNMEEWLNLVASCDAVVSVANTTIHGAGGLNIPTMCLLSLRSDWRWLKDSEVKRSYWYPSVGVARESKQTGWSPALKMVRHWIGRRMFYANWTGTARSAKMRLINIFQLSGTFRVMNTISSDQLSQMFSDGRYHDLIAIIRANDINPQSDPIAAHLFAAALFSVGEFAAAAPVLDDLEPSFGLNPDFLSLRG